VRVSVGGMRETGPIQLAPMTPEFLEALLADRREESEQELGISLFADYPDEDERRFLALRLRQMQEDARFQTWSEHAFVLRAQMVGHGGYDGPPGNNAAQAPDAVEFGYRGAGRRPPLRPGYFRRPTLRRSRSLGSSAS
jgi:hypothetical protein